MTVRMKVEGLKGVDRALEDLPAATAKNVARRVLKKAAQPLIRSAKSRAPVAHGDLKNSIGVSSRLTRSQRRFRNRKKDVVELYVGPSADPASHLQEFGSSIHSAQPYMRPAWDTNKRGMLDIVEAEIWQEVAKAAKRAARKRARQQGG